ncbi:MAG: hypothetical protein PUE71_02995 [Clostridia bacterium]|nr:hypothetical protein [Clostridia bacterium]
MRKQVRDKEQLLRKIEKYILAAPEGSLKFQQKNGKIYYYHQNKNIKTNRWEKTYIKKNQMNLAKSLAQKGYFLDVRSVLKEQLHLLHNFIGKYDEKGIDQIYSELPEERKILIEPVSVGLKEKMDAWNSEIYEPYLAFPDNMIYETEQGEMVRSKSELIIANVLYQYRNDIEYKYERPLELKTKDGNSIIVHPDFTIINKHTGRIYYYEHAGRMDEPKYASEFVKKMNMYLNNDILQERDLIVTYETYSMPLDISCVKKFVQSILG